MICRSFQRLRNTFVPHLCAVSAPISRNRQVAAAGTGFRYPVYLQRDSSLIKFRRSGRFAGVPYLYWGFSKLIQR